MSRQSVENWAISVTRTPVRIAGSGIATGLALALACAPLDGCAPTGQAPAVNTGAPLLLQPVTAADGGVEWRVLTVSLSAERLAEVFSTWTSEPPPLPASLHALWLGSGVRLSRIPTDQIASLQSQLATTTAGGPPTTGTSLSRLAIDPGPRWVEALRDAGSDTSRVIALADARQPIEPGIVRLLARCWPEPRMSDEGRLGAVVRLELLPAWVERGSLRRQRGLDELAGTAAVRGLEQQGVPIHRMLAGVLLGPGESLVLIHDLPHSARDDGPRAESAGSDAAPATAPRLGEVLRGTRTPDAPDHNEPIAQTVAGPQPAPGVGFRATTLGEILLTAGRTQPREGEQPDADGGTHTPPGRRLIVFATPRVPQRVSFIGR